MGLTDEQIMLQLDAWGAGFEPPAMAEILRRVLTELLGAIGARGWSVPAHQARFIAGRLEHYAGQLREAAEALAEVSVSDTYRTE